MTETCDKCGKSLSIEKSEDFFVETKDGSFIFCETHYLEFEKKRGRASETN
ncbi:hypothetical protein Gp_2 [Bacillus phage vB_Bacillus_1020A]|nr:hypothetical protein Gp_2 [Bacillus phage vB_Bacillus_1020A]